MRTGAPALAPDLYLASASPRRAELLRQAGYRPLLAPTGVPERRRPGEAPRALALRLARSKAGAAWRLLKGRGALSGVVLGADTVVDLDGRALGKPSGPAAARRMLRALSGRAHRVHTGVCLLSLGPGPRGEAFVETVSVRFRALDPAEIDAYVATGEPLDKAGSYGIQGRAGSFVRRVSGDTYAVVGLPLARVCEALVRVGLRP